ncbi:MAG TPA: hypothetical protein VN642_11975 [Dongiaceae bacterium]|nr:hypothetical protein [Dongiaceae bacterium]
MNGRELKTTVAICCTGLVLTALLSACGGSSDSTPTTPTTTTTTTPVSFSAKIQPIFNARCLGCHTTTGAASILVLNSGAYNNLVNRPTAAASTPTPQGILVKPGDSANSILYQRVSGIGLPSVQERMPLGGPFLSAEDQNLIKTWIDEGAKNN